jgi:hypothetical protein
MSGLSLALLSSFQADFNGRPLSRFRTKGVQALLIYLACQPDQNYQRELLMTMLSPSLPRDPAGASRAEKNSTSKLRLAFSQPIML